MVTNGFYKILYDGKTGSGIGMLVLLNGVASGVDEAGVEYGGVYSEDLDTGAVQFQLSATVPANVALVIGVPAKAEPWSFSFGAVLPPGFVSGTRVPIRTPFGTVAVGFKLLRAL